MKSPLPLLPIFFFFFFNLLVLTLVPIAVAGQRRVHIPDDDEDDDWKQWGQKSPSSPPDSDLGSPPDLSNMDLSKIQAEMMKRHVGPIFGFVKLRLGVRRNRDTVSEIATKWNKVLKTGGVEATFNAVDLNTIMFTLMRGQDAMELKEFLLDQHEAYEVKIGDRVFRRPGDPSLDEIVEKLHAEKHKVRGVHEVEAAAVEEEDTESKDEL